MAVMPDSRLLIGRMFLFTIFCGAAPALSAQADAPEPPRAGIPPSEPQVEPSLPSDAELEGSNARIGAIEIHILQIFDLADPQDNNWLFRTADQLHVLTRESTIRAQLLFRS